MPTCTGRCFRSSALKPTLHHRVEIACPIAWISLVWVSGGRFCICYLTKLSCLFHVLWWAVRWARE